MRLICWNTEHKRKSWDFLVSEHSDADAALLQEACEPTSLAAGRFDVGPGPWKTPGSNSARAIVGISDDVRVERISEADIINAGVPSILADKHIIAAAVIERSDGAAFFAVSVEAWERNARALPQVLKAITEASGRDLPFIVGGDFNVWRGREQTPIFDDMATAGVPLVGPFGPRGATTPTKFHRLGHETPADACRQLDYVFASSSIADTVTVQALNEVAEEAWGPSDHCRLLIELP